MKKMNGKLGKFALLSGAGAVMFGAPGYASAAGIGWSANEMINGTNTGGAMNITAVDQATIATWVQNFTTWILGIAIVIFVLRVVLTAIDRMVFSDQSEGNDGSFLRSIPYIGAYSDKDWKEIFKRFGLQLGVVAGAWIVVNIIAGAVLFVFSALGSQ